MQFGSKGQIPYVVLNGKETCDSNIIIPTLKHHFNVDCDAHLTSEQRAVGHTTTRMLEEHTAQIGFYYRYGLHMDDFYAALDVPERMFDAKESCKGSMIAWAWKRFQPGGTKGKVKSRGLASHSDAELWSFSADDLRAISDLLGQKTYFHGDQASLIDCVLFGHLSQFLFIPMDFPQKKFLLAVCQNVVQFVHRFRDTYWPDWEKLCAGNVQGDAPPAKSMANRGRTPIAEGAIGA